MRTSPRPRTTSLPSNQMTWTNLRKFRRARNLTRTTSWYVTICQTCKKYSWSAEANEAESVWRAGLASPSSRSPLAPPWRRIQTIYWEQTNHRNLTWTTSTTPWTKSPPTITRTSSKATSLSPIWRRREDLARWASLVTATRSERPRQRKNWRSSEKWWWNHGSRVAWAISWCPLTMERAWRTMFRVMVLRRPWIKGKAPNFR